MTFDVSLLLFLTGVALSNGGLSSNRYTVDTVKDFPATEEQDTSFWQSNALRSINEKLSVHLNKNKAKNLILFLGDGMSVSTITAARIYKGQLDQRAGENSKLSFEYFPYSGFSKTYCVDKQVADSACSATAYLGGVKANYGTLGVTAAVPRGNCTSSVDQNNHVQTILTWALNSGKGVGIVTTANITDASPAGGYAHVGDRHWESDKDVLEHDQDPKLCPDIAQQLIRAKPGIDVQVIFGGGRAKFLPKSLNDTTLGVGERLDEVNLVEEWLESKRARNSTAAFVHDRIGLAAKSTVTSDYIFGLFQTSDMYYHLDKNARKQPTLEELTQVAIERLSREENGYYLFVEGALIDKAHHKNWAHRALDETVEFSKAIERALKITNEEDTLIVVTADHSHTMTINGYPSRGNNILGTLENENSTYPTLSYANGPSANLYKEPEGHDFLKDDMSNDTYQYPSLVELIDETHGGDDVAVFAHGPWSHLFIGAYEQNLIPHMMAYAANIGPAASSAKLQITSSSSCISITLTFFLEFFLVCLLLKNIL